MTPTKVPFNDLKLLHAKLEDDIGPVVRSVIARSAFIGGDELESFETAFGEYCGDSLAVGVSNGTHAIELALRAIGVGSGDEIIVPALTFIATVEPIIQLNALPVLVDIDPDTYNLDPRLIEDAITPRTKVIMPVHLHGQPVDMEAITAIARRHDLLVVEDAAQAHGATFQGNTVGSLGDIAAFSFYPGKNLGAFGDAGAVVSKDTALIERVMRMRDHGRLPREKFGHRVWGGNYRMDNLQAAVLLAKLPHLDGWNAERRQIASRYDRGLGDFVKIPKVLTDAESVFHLYVISTDDRQALHDHLSDAGVASGIHYPQPIHLHECMTGFTDTLSGDFPRAEHAANHILSLPIFPFMSDQQVGQVVTAIRDYALANVTF